MFLNHGRGAVIVREEQVFDLHAGCLGPDCERFGHRRQVLLTTIVTRRYNLRKHIDRMRAALIGFPGRRLSAYIDVCRTQPGAAAAHVVDRQNGMLRVGVGCLIDLRRQGIAITNRVPCSTTIADVRLAAVDDI